MQLNRLSVRNFRNYESLELNFAPGLSVFTGKNAQGKTNLLEAIHVLCTGRSHRTRQDREMIHHDENMKFLENAHISASCLQHDGNHTIDVTLTLQGKKAIRVNNSSLTRLGDLMGHMNAVMFSPEDLNLIKDGPSVRRRFMDMTLSQTRKSYFFTLQNYQKALMQRNELLKMIARENRGLDMMDIWEMQLAEAGALLSMEREKFTSFISEKAAEIHCELTHGQEQLELSYDNGLNGTKEQRIEQLTENLLHSREKDLRFGTTSSGPHRDDIIIRINGADARTDASQGQRRTAVLSMKLAELRLMEEITGEAPLLLLDDVFSELDAARRDMLQSYIDRVQTFITCVDMESLSLHTKNVHVFKVENGQIL